MRRIFSLVITDWLCLTIADDLWSKQNHKSTRNSQSMLKSNNFLLHNRRWKNIERTPSQDPELCTWSCGASPEHEAHRLETFPPYLDSSSQNVISSSQKVLGKNTALRTRLFSLWPGGTSRLLARFQINCRRARSSSIFGAMMSVRFKFRHAGSAVTRRLKDLCTDLEVRPLLDSVLHRS